MCIWQPLSEKARTLVQIRRHTEQANSWPELLSLKLETRLWKEFDESLEQIEALQFQKSKWKLFGMGI